MKIKAYHVAVAAEALVAAQFARCGYDISIQYGANQPEYDLTVTLDDKILKISVKGSQDGGWGLTQSYIKNADYHGAIEKWLNRHKEKTIFCFVQFKDCDLNQFPRLYLATPEEVAERLKKSVKGRGETILYENHVWTKKGQGAGTVEKIPDTWRFSSERIKDLFGFFYK
jgi:hypothetical protein